MQVDASLKKLALLGTFTYITIHFYISDTFIRFYNSSRLENNLPCWSNGEKQAST
jgi:hypothetical protein